MFIDEIQESPKAIQLLRYFYEELPALHVSAYKGAIIPHLVTQELISLQSISAQAPNFWVRERAQSNAEVDLLYTYGKLVIPIKIKSGSTGSLKLLHQFIEAANHPYAIRIYAGVFKVEQAITPNKKPYLLMNLPYYAGAVLPEYIEWFIQQTLQPKISVL